MQFAPRCARLRTGPLAAWAGSHGAIWRSRGLGVDDGNGDMAWQDVDVGIGDEVGRAIIRAARPPVGGRGATGGRWWCRERSAQLARRVPATKEHARGVTA